MQTTPSIAVMYHADCNDGFGAAWAAHKTLGPAAVYIPIAYGRSASLPRGIREIHMLDWTPPAEMAERWIAQLARGELCGLTLIDHHATAEKLASHMRDMKARGMVGLVEVFSTENSAAVLAWRHYHPHTPCPRLLRYVEDRDLWRWQLPDSRAVSQALYAMRRDFDEWSVYADAIDPLIERGNAMLAFSETIVTQAVTRAETRVIPPHLSGDERPLTVVELNCTACVSDTHEAMRRMFPDADVTLTYAIVDDVAQVSLRSTSYDVAALAKRFGGGGHHQASGFKMEAAAVAAGRVLEAAFRMHPPTQPSSDAAPKESDSDAMPQEKMTAAPVSQTKPARNAGKKSK